MELLKKKKKKEDIFEPISTRLRTFAGPLNRWLFHQFQRDFVLRGETHTGERGGQRTISNIYSLNFTIKKTL